MCSFLLEPEHLESSSLLRSKLSDSERFQLSYYNESKRESPLQAMDELGLLVGQEM